MTIIKRYLLWFIWSSWRRYEVGFPLTVGILFFAPWLSLIEVVDAPSYRYVLVVEQNNYAVLTVIPYSFLALLLLPEHPRIYQWLHRIKFSL